jgi:hypothetical protein
MAHRVPFVVAELGADVDPFVLHLFAALAEKERSLSVAIGGTGNVTHGGGTGASFLSGSCDPGFTISEIGLVTRWTPVKNLTFSAEVLYA